MKLKNTTIFSKDLIKEVIRFVKPSDVSKFNVEVKHSNRGYSATAFYHRPRIVIRIGDNTYPCKFTKREGLGYLESFVFSPTELLVKLIAHELRHLWQCKHPKGWRVWGARGRFSERDADAYAIHKVREWRRR